MHRKGIVLMISVLRGHVRRWAFVAMGVIILIIGLVAGLLGSHTVGLKKGPAGGIFVMYPFQDTGDLLLHPDGTSDYYIAYSSDFSIKFTSSNLNNAKG